MDYAQSEGELKLALISWAASEIANSSGVGKAENAGNLDAADAIGPDPGDN